MLTKEKKQEIIKEYATKEGDTGSPEVQVAILTYRINDLNAHLKEHAKDFLRWSVREEISSSIFAIPISKDTAA